MKTHFLWCEKYRPKTVEECILPSSIKNTFKGFVKEGQLPNLILCGGPGIGKTSIAKAAIAELGAETMFLNGSLNAGIDVLRNDIAGFASAMAWEGVRKYVIFDEADWLTPTVQAALRNFMEEFAANCFHRDTKVMTLEHGTVPISSIEGTKVTTRCRDGVWRKVSVKNYGKQKLWKYYFGKFNSTSKNIHHEVIATENHRWYLDDGSVTSNIEIGDRLMVAPPETARNSMGVIHGMIFGDGYGHKSYRQEGLFSSIQGRIYSSIRLCKSDKVQHEMFEWLTKAGYTPNYPPSANGDPVFQLGYIPYVKDLPHTNDPEYIAGFIYGWWLADGSKDHRERLQISTINKNAIEWLKDYASYAGFRVTGLSSRPSGSGGYPNSKELFVVTLNNKDVPVVRGKEFFGEDDVFCFEEPVTNGFILSNGLVTGNCSFILTANYRNKIMKELHSRCSVIDFSYDAKTRAKMATQFYKRALTILASENVEYNVEVVAKIVNKWFPDSRRILNQLQSYAKANGKIDSGVLTNFEEISMSQLYSWMKEKDFTKVRKWAAENADTYQYDLYERIYNTLEDHLTPQSIPAVVDILGEWQYRAAFAQHAEINVAACLSNIMAVAEWR